MACEQWAEFCGLVAQLTSSHSPADTRSSAGARLLAAFDAGGTAQMLCSLVLPPLAQCSCASSTAPAASPTPGAAHEEVQGIDEATLFFAIKALRAAVTSPGHDHAAAVADVMLQLCLHSHCAFVTPVVRMQCHLGIADAAKMSVAHKMDGSSELSDYVFEVLAEACNSSDPETAAAAFAALTTLITEMVQADSRLTIHQQQSVAQYRALRFRQLCDLCVNISEATIGGFSRGEYNLVQHRQFLLGCVQTLQAFTSDSSNYDMLTEKFFEALFAAVEVSLSYIRSDTADSIVDICDNVCTAVGNVIKRRYVPAGDAGVWFMTTLAQRTLAILTNLQNISNELPPNLSLQFVDVVEQFVRIHLMRFLSVSAEAQQFFNDVCVVISDVSKFSHDHTLMACVGEVWTAILDLEAPVSTLLEQQTQVVAAGAHSFLCAALSDRNPELFEAMLEDEYESMTAYDSMQPLSAITADEGEQDDNKHGKDPSGVGGGTVQRKPSIATALTVTESEDFESSPLAEFYSRVRNVLFRMCQFPAVQHAIGEAVHSTLPALLGRIMGDMRSEERAAQVLDVCFLMSLLPVASGTAEAMSENLLGIMSTVKHAVAERLFSAAPAFGFLACCATDIVIPVLASLSSHIASWESTRLETLLTLIAECVDVSLDFFMMPPPIGIAASGAQLLRACCRHLSPQTLYAHAGMASVLDKARNCLGNSSVPGRIQSELLLSLLELVARSQDTSTYTALLNSSAHSIDLLRTHQSPNVLFGASISAECLAFALFERSRHNKEERVLVFETLSPIFQPSNMLEYFMACMPSQAGKAQAVATAQTLLDLLFVAVRNYGKHLDNLLVVDVVGRSMDFVSHSFVQKAQSGALNGSKDLHIFRSAMHLLQQACQLGLNADANLQTVARVMSVVKELSSLFEDPSQIMPDLLFPAVRLLATAINRLWRELAGNEAGFAVQVGLVELCNFTFATDSMPPECTQTCALRLIELDSQRDFFAQPWFAENFWLELSKLTTQLCFSSSGAATLYGDDISQLLYRLARVDVSRFMQSVISPILTAAVAANPDAGLENRRQFIYEQAVGHWTEVVAATEQNLPEHLFVQALTRCKHDINALFAAQAGLFLSDR